MSLISIRNFLTPFTNTTNLVTIILITVVFALIRIQGGGFTFRSNDRGAGSDSRGTGSAKTAPTTPRLGTSDDLESIGILPPKNPGAAQRKELPDEGTIEVTPEERDLLGQMIGKRDNAAQDHKDVAPPPGRSKPKTGNSLDDIERTLGIR